MRQNNLELGNYFAHFFNKKYGFITYSGTLAIEIALKMLLTKKSKILINSHVCYSIVNTILKLDMIPVIVIPKNDLFLVDEDIEEIKKTHKIDGILLVHQYGIINNINKLKYHNMGIKIIEDVAQVWDVDKTGFQVGVNSDAVVTSFGKTKPLSYGIGGGIFVDNRELLSEVDYCDNESRESENILLSYGYPLCEEIDTKSLLSVANNYILEQRNNVKKYCEVLNKKKNYNIINLIINFVMDGIDFQYGWKMRRSLKKL